jgi:hypothetical protein
MVMGMAWRHAHHFALIDPWPIVGWCEPWQHAG